MYFFNFILKHDPDILWESPIQAILQIYINIQLQTREKTTQIVNIVIVRSSHQSRLFIIICYLETQSHTIQRQSSMQAKGTLFLNPDHHQYYWTAVHQSLKLILAAQTLRPGQNSTPPQAQIPHRIMKDGKGEKCRMQPGNHCQDCTYCVSLLSVRLCSYFEGSSSRSTSHEFC